MKNFCYLGNAIKFLNKAIILSFLILLNVSAYSNPNGKNTERKADTFLSVLLFPSLFPSFEPSPENNPPEVSKARPTGCTYHLRRTSARVPVTASSRNVFGFTAYGDNCQWTPVSNAPWITNVYISSTRPDLSDSWDVSYSCQANPTTAERSGTITMAGYTFTVTQEAIPCTFSLPVTAANLPATEGTGSLSVETNGSTCTWSATVAAVGNWISIPEGQAMSGSKALNYSYRANPATTGRTGTITVNGNIYTLTQAAGSCAISVSPTTAAFSRNAGTGSFRVLVQGTDCPQWTASVAADGVGWLSITGVSTGTSVETINYTFRENTAAARTGTIIVQGSRYTVTQEGTCTFSLSNSSGRVPAGATTGTPTEGEFRVTFTGADCQWTPVSNVGWITNVYKSSYLIGANARDVFFWYAANPSTSERTGTISITGTGLTYTVTQSGSACATSLPFTAGSVLPNGAGTASLAVETNGRNCTWSASVSAESAGWISIPAGQTMTGSKSLNYSYLPNPTTARRTGTINVEGHTYTVTQAAGECSVTLSSASDNKTFDPGRGSVDVTVTGTACPQWAAAVEPDAAAWLTVDPDDRTGTGSKTIHYSFTTNTSTANVRRGTILVHGNRYTVIQATMPSCQRSLSVNSARVPFGTSSGSFLFTSYSDNDYANLCNSWSPVSNVPWITNVTKGSAANSAGEWTISYSCAINTATAERHGTITMAGYTFTVMQSGAACTFQLSDNSISVPSPAGYRTYRVVANGDECEWTPVVSENAREWLSIVTEVPLRGTIDFTYKFKTNYSTSPRAGTITIPIFGSLGGQAFTVTQGAANCEVKLPSLPTIVAAAGGRAELRVESPGTDCELWRASVMPEDRGWLSITGDNTGTSSKTIYLNLTENTATVGRTGYITVRDKTHTVIQGRRCIYTTVGRSGNVAATASVNNTFEITVEGDSYCEWTHVSSNPWITNISKAHKRDDTWTITYSCGANPTNAERTGSITIPGSGALSTYNVIQAAGSINCVYTPASLTGTATSTAGTGEMQITTNRGDCPWTVEAAADSRWITAINKEGSGAGTIRYSFSENPFTTPRTGTITVGDHTHTLKTTYTITQARSLVACTYTLPSPPSTRVLSAAGTGSVRVTTNRTVCPWTASVAAEAAWLTVTNTEHKEGREFIGSQTIEYSYTANPSTIERSATITVMGQAYLVIQPGAPCTLSLNAPSADVQATTGTGSVGVVSNGIQCAWTATVAQAAASWLTVAEGSKNGAGTGTVNYSYTANTGDDNREGVITVGGNTYTVKQSGADCRVTLSRNTESLPATAGTGSLGVTLTYTGCRWTIRFGPDANRQPTWLTITDPENTSNRYGSGTANYAYTANTSTFPRTEVITIGGQRYTVTQAAGPCVFTLPAPTANVPATAGTKTVEISTNGTNCTWTAATATDTPWITIAAGERSGTGGKIIRYSFEANPTTTARTGSLTVGGQTHTITQTGAVCAIRLSPPSANLQATEGTGSLEMVANGSECRWTAGVPVNSNWIVIREGESGIGSGTIRYTFKANPLTTARTGIIIAAGQNYTVTQAGATLPCALTVNAATGTALAAGGTGNIEVTANRTDCPWTTEVPWNTGWVTVSQGASGTGSGTVRYACEANPLSVERTATLTVAGHTYTLTQEAGVAACSFTLTSGSGSAAATAGRGLFEFTANQTYCTWTAEVPLNSRWITLREGDEKGTGSGTVRYSYAANPLTAERTGTIIVGGQTYTLTQAGAAEACSITPASTSADVPATQGEGRVEVTANRTDCVWAANIPWHTSWLSIAAGEKGTGSGTVSYKYEANPLTAERTGIIIIGLQSYTVTQAGAAIACTFTLPVSTGRVEAAAGTGNFRITTNRADCFRTAEIPSNAGWITILEGKSGTGSGTINYSYTANPLTAERTGIITVGGQAYTLTQAAATEACSYTLSSNTANAAATAGSGSVEITTNRTHCEWAAEVSVNAKWITVRTGRGKGSGTINYTYEANPLTASRTATITVGGQTCTLSQAGAAAACSFALSSNTGSATATAGSGSVGIITYRSDCPWTAEVSTNAGWLSVFTGKKGTGSGTILYLYEANPGTAERTATITVAGETYRLTQAGASAACSFTLSATTGTAAAATGSGSLGVVTNRADCTWTAEVSANAGWILIYEGAGGTGSGLIRYTCRANPLTAERTGTITVGGQTYTLTQAGATTACSYTLSATAARATAAPGAGSVGVTTNRSNCPWAIEVSAQAGWITILGNVKAGNGSTVINYAYAASPLNTDRIGTFTIGGQTFTLTQAGNCSYTLEPAEGRVGASASSTETTGKFSVTVRGSGCSWMPVTNADWITHLTKAESANAAGAWEVTYSYTENPSAAERRGIITVADQTHTVLQSGTYCAISLPSTAANVPAAAGTEKIAVTANGPDCPWTAAVSTSAAWLSIPDGQTMTGSKDLNYSFKANPSTTARTGTIIVSTVTFTVTQAGAPCSISLPSTSGRVSAEEGAGSFVVEAAANCTWSASTTATWLSIPEGQTTTGSKNLNYTYRTNPSLTERRGIITVGGHDYTVTQAYGKCSFSLFRESDRVPAAAGSGIVSVIAPAIGCTWTAAVGPEFAAWLSIGEGEGKGGGSKAFNYSYKENTSTVSRIGTIEVAGLTYTLTQEGICSYNLTSSSANVATAAGKGVISVVTGNNSCTWTALSNASWISVPAGQKTGNGDINYTYEENTGDIPRTGTITVADKTFTLNQSSLVTGMEPIGRIKIFPNPAKDFVTIDLSAKEIKCVSVKIVNQAGQTIYKLDSPPDEALQIPLKGYAGGMYFIFLQGEEKVWVHKFIVK